MILSILLLITGLLILIFGANYIVEGASALAGNFNISNLAIGLTVVAFGTSAPELVVNIFASTQGLSDIVFGNVLGSNNFNLFFILGVTGLITPLAVQSSTAWKEIPISFIAVILLYLLVNDIFFNTEDSFLGSIDGVILLVCFVLFLYFVYRQLKTDSQEVESLITTRSLSGLKITLFIIGGLAGMIYGGHLVINNAFEIAEAFGLSQKIIGLTVVAAGTSLPELATSIVATYKKNADIAVGNIIGSNIFNIFFILGISAVITPISFAPIFNNDLYVLSGGTIFLFLAMFIGGWKKLDRREAALLPLFFLSYTTYLVMQEF